MEVRISRDSTDRPNKLTPSQCSFFIAMGGTTIARSGSSPARITLTPEGFEYLLATNFLQPSCLEKAAIMDKGKADFIAKFLVRFGSARRP